MTSDLLIDLVRGCVKMKVTGATWEEEQEDDSSDDGDGVSCDRELARYVEKVQKR